MLGLGPIGDMAARIAMHRGACKVIGIDVVSGSARAARGRGRRVLDFDIDDDLVGAVRDMTDGRGLTR